MVLDPSPVVDLAMVLVRRCRRGGEEERRCGIGGGEESAKQPPQPRYIALVSGRG